MLPFFAHKIPICRILLVVQGRHPLQLLLIGRKATAAEAARIGGRGDDDVGGAE